MNIESIAVGVVAVLIFVIRELFVNSYVKYIAESSKNAATKEDLKDLTTIVESVKVKFTKEIEILKNEMNKDIEILKNEMTKDVEILKNEMTKDIEVLKNKLNKESIEFQIRLSKYHDKKINALAEVFESLSELNSHLISMSQPFKRVRRDEEKEEIKRINAASAAYQKAYQAFIKNKLFIDKEICQLIKEFINKGFNIHFDYLANFELNKDGSDDGLRSQAINAYRESKDNLPKLIDKIEEKFRKLIK